MARGRQKAKEVRADKVIAEARTNAAKIIAEAEAIEAAADKTNADADELHQRCEQQLRDSQDKERKALASAHASRRAIAKTDAKEKTFQAKIDLLQEALAELSR